MPGGQLSRRIVASLTLCALAALGGALLVHAQTPQRASDLDIPEGTGPDMMPSLAKFAEEGDLWEDMG